MDAAAGRPADRVADGRRRLGPQVEVVLRELERALGAVEELGDRGRDLVRPLAAVGQSTDGDVGVHRSPRGGQDRGDVQLLPGRRAGRAAARAARRLPRGAPRRADPARGRGAGIPRRPRLGHPVDLGAPAHRLGAGRGDRHGRPPDARRARPGERRPALERRAHAPRRRHARTGRPTRAEIEAGIAVRARAGPWAARRRRRPRRARGVRRRVRSAPRTGRRRALQSRARSWYHRPRRT